MIRINLLPVRAAQKKERIRSQLSIFLLCLILVFIGCGALYAQKRAEINDTKNEISNINNKNNALKKKIGEVRNFETKKSELEQKLNVLYSLKENKSGPVHLLDELSSALPENLWMTKFVEKNGVITLSGVADTEYTVATFMKNLEASPYYQNVELSVTEQSKISETKMQKFTLICQVKLPSTK